MPAYNDKGVLCLRIKEYAAKHCRVPERIGLLMREGRIPWELINGLKHIPSDAPYPERKPMAPRPGSKYRVHCGRKAQPDWSFCPRCGERLP